MAKKDRIAIMPGVTLLPIAVLWIVAMAFATLGLFFLGPVWHALP